MICYAERKKPYSIALCEAFAAGCGGTVNTSRIYAGGPALISGMGEWQKSMMAQCDEWWEADYGYLQRGEYWRITHKAFWCDGSGETDYKRLSNLNINIQKRAKVGGNVLVIGQSRKFYALWAGRSEHEVLRDLQIKIAARTKRQIVIRRKPLNGRWEPPLQKQLNEAWIVVTHSSGVALQALMQGIPVVVLDSSYAPHRLSTEMDKIDTPFIPSVDEVRHLCGVLAANQWSFSEMRSGQAWRSLLA